MKLLYNFIRYVRRMIESKFQDMDHIIWYIYMKISHTTRLRTKPSKLMVEIPRLEDSLPTPGQDIILSLLVPLYFLSWPLMPLLE